MRRRRARKRGQQFLLGTGFQNPAQVRSRQAARTWRRHACGQGARADVMESKSFGSRTSCPSEREARNTLAIDPKYLNPSVQRIVLDMETESTISIVGQLALTPDGQRVIVEKVGAEIDSSARAIVRQASRPEAGTRSTCFVSSLKPLGFEIPLE